MRNIRISDIGDGLAMNIETIKGVDIQIDCGSQQKSHKLLESCFLYNSEMFFLSHFHSDHYNGLNLALDNTIKLNIEKLYFPKLPKFKQSIKFLKCLFAMNMTLGGYSGNMETDFINLVRKLNNKSFKYKALSKGDIEYIGGEKVEILWPPKKLNNKYFLISVNNALKKFDKALEKDSSLKENFNKIEKTDVIKKYTQNEVINCEQKNDNEKWNNNINVDNEIPKETKEANTALRSVANRLSLAFHIDNSLLFMGDLEATEIKKVVEILIEKQTVSFYTMIAPHHGTHWNEILRKLSSDICVSSIGSRLLRNAKNDYKNISNTTLWTYLNGDIFIPFRPRYSERYYTKWY